MIKAISKKDRDKTVHYLVGEGSKALSENDNVKSNM
jgi:hypothetical protein